MRCLRRGEAGRQGLLSEPKQGAAAGDVAVAPPRALGYSRPELVDSFTGLGTDTQDRNRPPTRKFQRSSHLRLHPVRTRHVGLMDDDDVGYFEDAGLLPLEV